MKKANFESGARFSNVLIVTGGGKLLPFTSQDGSFNSFADNMTKLSFKKTNGLVRTARTHAFLR